MNFAETLPLIWPLTFLLIALFLLRKADDALQPIITGVVGGVAKNATQHALAYAMATILAVLSGLEALGEVATQFHWVYVIAGAKILTPMLATVVAYLTKKPSFTQPTPDPVPPKAPTAPPFSSAPQPPNPPNP